MDQLPSQNYISPASQMQQLVSHWNTIMKPVQSSRKRSRNDDCENRSRATKSKTQSHSQPISNDSSLTQNASVPESS